MVEAIRDRAGYIRQCAHASGDVILCARCLMSEADAVDRRMAKTLAETVDLRASVNKACRELKKTQAEVARLMGLYPAHLSGAKNGNRPLAPSALKWLSSQGYLVLRKEEQAG
jgi:hypothetical protein